MKRLAASLAACALTATGCVPGQWFVDPRLNGGVPIATPEAPKVDADAYAIGKRVDVLGKRIVDQNTFTGLDPLFHTLGVSEPVLFHRGPDELFISAGLVKRCKTESQLAAVLCGELGWMMTEKRSAKAVGVNLESVREVSTEPEAIGAGQIVSAAPPVARKPSAADPPAAARLARELLHGAGFDSEELAKSSVLLVGVKRDVGAGIGRQLAGPAPAPLWQK